MRNDHDAPLPPRPDRPRVGWDAAGTSSNKWYNVFKHYDPHKAGSDVTGKGAMMDTASKLLILGGVLNLFYGLITGIPAGLIRQKQPTYSKYLRLVHVGALMWGPILLSLVVAIALSPLDAGLETVAAALMVVASILLDAKDTINWRMGVQDEFAEKVQVPLLFGTLSSLASLLGTVIILIGVVQGVLQ